MATEGQGQDATAVPQTVRPVRGEGSEKQCLPRAGQPQPAVLPRLTTSRSLSKGRKATAAPSYCGTREPSRWPWGEAGLPEGLRREWASNPED